MVVIILFLIIITVALVLQLLKRLLLHSCMVYAALESNVGPYHYGH